VAAAVVLEIVVAVEVAVAGLLVAEPQVERRGARIVVINAEPDLAAATLAGEGLGGADDGRANAAGPERARPAGDLISALTAYHQLII
jgi:hypothetical protein